MQEYHPLEQKWKEHLALVNRLGKNVKQKRETVSLESKCHVKDSISFKSSDIAGVMNIDPSKLKLPYFMPDGQKHMVCCLSLLCFLIRTLADFTNHYDEWEGHFATDSQQSLFDTLFGLKTQTRGGRHLFMHSTRGTRRHDTRTDVLILIQERLRRLPIVDIQHIKGHQDKHVPYDSPTLLAQFNVDDDDMASLFQKAHGRLSPFTILPTQIGAALQHLPQGTVTTHHISSLHSAASGPPLVHYMSRKITGRSRPLRSRLIGTHTDWLWSLIVKDTLSVLSWLRTSCRQIILCGHSPTKHDAPYETASKTEIILFDALIPAELYGDKQRNEKICDKQHMSKSEILTIAPGDPSVVSGRITVNWTHGNNQVSGWHSAS